MIMDMIFHLLQIKSMLVTTKNFIGREM